MTHAQAQMGRADFEARYRADSDPWGYETSEYERDKYAATLDACGPGPFEAAVELGGSIGVFSELLAPRCSRLVTLDYSPTAVGLARERLAARDNVQALIGSIPQNLPAGQFELIVASEILYYLASADVAATVGWVASALKPGGTLVCVHWRRHGPERPLTAEAVHTTVRNSPALIWTRSGSTDEYLLDSFQRR